MKCPSCGTDVGPDDDFCGECGTQLAGRRGRRSGLPVVIGIIAAIGVGACVCLAVLYTFWPSEPTATPETVARATGTSSAGRTSTPAATSAVPPTPEPTIIVPPAPTLPAWPLVLEDKFDDPQSGFSNGSYEGTRYFYEGGSYGIETIGANLISWTSLGHYSDLVLEVTVVSEEQAGEAGVLFRKEGERQFYLFTVSTDGGYKLRKNRQSGAEGWETLLDWSETPHLETGVAANRLQVVCVGSQISLYANGQYLMTVLDSSYARGEIGLAVGTLTDARALFYFDDLRVYAPAAGPEMLWQDDFSDPGSGWEVSDYAAGSVNYENGAYVVTASAQSYMWGAANTYFGDGSIEVDATQVVGPANDNNGYGIVCRVQSNGDGYYFRISGDGFYGIHKFVDGQSDPLVDWTASEVINQGNALNRISAVCNGSSLELTVNGQVLAQVSDSSFTEGDVGLTASSFEEGGGTEISFDNLVVYSESIG
jgi:hypothetical protein